VDAGSQARVEALRAERERIDEAITEARFVGAELQGATVALLVEVGNLGRRLQGYSPQRPRMPGWRPNSKPMLVVA